MAGFIYCGRISFSCIVFGVKLFMAVLILVGLLLANFVLAALLLVEFLLVEFLIFVIYSFAELLNSIWADWFKPKYFWSISFSWIDFGVELLMARSDLDKFVLAELLLVELLELFWSKSQWRKYFIGLNIHVAFCKRFDVILTSIFSIWRLTFAGRLSKHKKTGQNWKVVKFDRSTTLLFKTQLACET